MKKIALFVLICCGVCFGQGWTGIVNSTRATDWSHGGLPATLPDGEATASPWDPPTGRTQCGATVSCANNSTDAATINTALAACTGAHFVKLGATTCSITSNIFMWRNGGSGPLNEVSLIGSGAMSTTLNFSGASTEFQYGVCCTGFSFGNLSLSSYAAGTTTVTITGVGSGTNLVVNNTAWIQQCDTGWSGTGLNGTQPNCTTGSYVDSGDIYVCGVDVPICTNDINPSGVHTYQRQKVLITGVVNNGGGSFTVTYTPGLYLPNWSSANNALMIWQDPANGSIGMGLENMTVNFTTNTTEKIETGGYAWWVRGVRITGYPQNPNVPIGGTHGLFANNYIFGNTPGSFNNNLSETILRSGDNDNLLINNIITQSICAWADGQTSGDIIAYNYCRDAQTLYYIAVSLDHLPWEDHLLTEGNQFPQIQDDSTHGTHGFNTYFRNYVRGWDDPYVLCTCNPWAFGLTNYQRFDTLVGNIVGNANSTAYQGTSFSVGNEFVNPSHDLIAQVSEMRWGNCDVFTGTCRFNSGEVPSGLHAYTPGPNITLSGSGLGPYTGTVVTGRGSVALGDEVVQTGYPANPGDTQDSAQNGNFQSQCVGGTNQLTYCSNSSACTGGGTCPISAGSYNDTTGAITVTFTSTPGTTPVFQYVYDSGSASNFANAQPANNNLPCSFFMAAFTAKPCAPATGSGLSWAKVCTNWTTFPVTCASSTTNPFPWNGPEVTGGPYVNGHGYDIPAALAYLFLPIDTNLQNSLTIAGQIDCTGTGGAASSWAGGIETLCVDMSSIDNGSAEHAQGGFQLSGTNAACSPSGINFANLYGSNEVNIVGATRRTTRMEIQYALTPNPGVSCSGTFKFPDVRQFSEKVFQADTGGAGGTPGVPTGQIILTQYKEREGKSHGESPDNAGAASTRLANH